MLYFKKVYFNHSDKANIESAFRKSAIRRDSLSSLELSKSDIGSDKRLFGYENEKVLYFMRIKSSVEFFLPNIIFSLPKDDTSFYYAFRLSRLASVLLFFLCVGLIFNLSQVIIGDVPFESFLIVSVFPLLFLSLIWLELKITLSKIKKIILKQQTAPA